MLKQLKTVINIAFQFRLQSEPYIVLILYVCFGLVKIACTSTVKPAATQKEHKNGLSIPIIT